MKSRLSLPVLLLFVLLPTAVFAQVPNPVIRSIEPASGPVTGGTFVTLIGDHLTAPDNFACILPCPPLVSFGGATVEASIQSKTVLVVRTPQHDAGAVDVRLQTPDGRTTTVAGGFVFTSASESNYERVLLPVYLDGTVPGANGSRWRTDLWLRNNGSEGVALAPWPCPDGGTCPAVFPLTRTVLPGETLRGLLPFFRPPTSNPSRVLFIEKANAKNVSMNLRIFDESRAAVDAGAEIPVVHERDFLTTKTQLHAVPLFGAYRVMLRVYDTAQTSARFRVRVYGERVGTNQGVPITEFDLTATTRQTGEFRYEAAYADYSGLTDLLQLPNVFPEFVRFEIEPLTSGSRYWAFVSVTNNDTQRVTLITP
jgi:hypothetical protein